MTLALRYPAFACYDIAYIGTISIFILYYGYIIFLTPKFWTAQPRRYVDDARRLSPSGISISARGRLDLATPPSPRWVTPPLALPLQLAAPLLEGVGMRVRRGGI